MSLALFAFAPGFASDSTGSIPPMPTGDVDHIIKSAVGALLLGGPVGTGRRARALFGNSEPDPPACQDFEANVASDAKTVMSIAANAVTNLLGETDVVDICEDHCKASRDCFCDALRSDKFDAEMDKLLDTVKYATWKVAKASLITVCGPGTQVSWNRMICNNVCPMVVSMAGSKAAEIFAPSDSP